MFQVGMIVSVATLSVKSSRYWPDLIVTRVLTECCLFRTSMESLAKSDGSFCLSLSSEGRLRLREDHDYYYQVQGELNITKRQVCYFVGQWRLKLPGPAGT